jgi:hypothetical protein
MASFAIRHLYELRLAANDDLSHWRDALDEVPGYLRGVDKTATLTEHPGSISIRVEVWAALESTDSWNGITELKRRNEAIESGITSIARRWSFMRDAQEMSRALQAATPRVEVRVPLRTDDANVIQSDATADLVVRQVVAETFPHWTDVIERLSALQTRLEGDQLVLELESGEFGVDVASAYLRSPRRLLRRSAPGAKPVWAWASTAIALLSVGLSFLVLNTATLLVLGALVAAITALAIVVSPRWAATRRITFLGIVPTLTLCAFGCAYGAISLLCPELLGVSDAPLGHLREPLLLSLGLLSTAGFLDVEIHGWVRSVAYFEMLLAAGLAGGAAIALLRRASQRFEEALTELRNDRMG